MIVIKSIRQQAIHRHTHMQTHTHPYSRATPEKERERTDLLWSSYDRIWFSRPDKQEKLI
jgi:hypothetical protein